MFSLTEKANLVRGSSSNTPDTFFRSVVNHLED